MAGLGTDIALGGLWVILTEYHESPRIDRQLLGRCARQGQAGECLAVVALTDDRFVQHGGWLARWLARLPAQAQGLRRWLSGRSRRAAQGRAERMHARTRRDTTRRDRELERSMGFSGDLL